MKIEMHLTSWITEYQIKVDPNMMVNFQNKLQLTPYNVIMMGGDIAVPSCRNLAFVLALDVEQKEIWRRWRCVEGGAGDV